jgi:hypothetical protein
MLSDRAILVRFSVSMPGNSRTDKKITAEVKSQKHLGDDTGKWLKFIYPPNALDPLTKIAGNARTYHYEQTLPWGDEGLRILPTKNHFPYMEKMRAYREEFEGQVEKHFVAKYDEFVAWAKQKHNGEFNERDYPGASIVKRKFGFSIDCTPVPTGNDFRVDMPAKELERMRESVEERVKESVELARVDLWKRLHSPLRHMAEQLAKPEARVFSSLLGNIGEVCELIPALNITGDANLERFKADVSAMLAGVSPEALRENNRMREDIAGRAQALADKMGAYFN